MRESSGFNKNNIIERSDPDLTFTKISGHLNQDQENSNIINLNNNMQTYMLITDRDGGEYLFEIGEKLFVGSLGPKCHILIKDLPEIFFAIGFRKGQVLFKHFGADHFLYKDYDLIPAKTYHLPINAELSCPFFKVTILNYKPFSMALIPLLDPSLFVLLQSKTENEEIVQKVSKEDLVLLKWPKALFAFFLRFAIIYKSGPYFGTIGENYPLFSNIYLKVHLWFENLIINHNDLFLFFLDNPQDIKASSFKLASLFSGAILFDLCCHLSLGVSLGEAFLGIDQKEGHLNKRLKGVGRCLLSYLFFPFIILSITGKGLAEKICKFNPVPTLRPLPVELVTGLLGLVICFYSFIPQNAKIVKEVVTVPTPVVAPPLVLKKVKEKKQAFLGLIKDIEIGHIVETKGPIIRKSLVINDKNEKIESKIQANSKVFHHDFLSLGNGAFLKIQLNNGKILEVMQKTDATLYSFYHDVEKDLEIVLDFGKVVYDTNQDIHNKVIQKNKYTPSLLLRSEDSAASPITGRGQFSYRKSLLLTTLFTSEGQSLFFPFNNENERHNFLVERAVKVGPEQFSVYYHHAWKASVPVSIKKQEVKKESDLYNLFHQFSEGGEFNPISGLYFLKENNYFDILLKLRTEKGAPIKNILENGEKIIFERVDIIGRIETRKKLF